MNTAAPSYPVYLSPRSVKLLLSLFGAILILAVLQDLLFSFFRNTGFYWSESVLYNSYFLFFIPLILLQRYLLSSLCPTRRLTLLRGIGLSTPLLTGLHMLLFTSFFIGISRLMFHPSHHFVTILSSVISNRLSISLVVFTIIPLIAFFTGLTREHKYAVSPLPDRLLIQCGARKTFVDPAAILLIRTDRPYAVIQLSDRKILSELPLKIWRHRLRNGSFVQANRSVIINSSYLLEMRSRKNGDYDAVLTGGERIRMSRHFREDWAQLLHQSA